MSIVDIRIKHHEANYICSNPRMTVTRIKQKLKQLGEKFVFVPADKAANNVVIVWRRYYIEVLRNEITNSNTFEATVSSEQQITENHHKLISLLSTSSDNITVPTLYWLPKLHKKAL